MKRQQLALIAIPLLAGIWFLLSRITRTSPTPPISPSTPSQSLASMKGLAPREHLLPPEEEKAVVGVKEFRRDPFQMSLQVKGVIRRREEERAREEEERLRAAQQKAQVPEEMVPAQPVVLPSLTLQGILWGVERPMAIINRKIVRQGDKVEGAEVIRIAKDGVTLRFQGQEFNLSLLTSEKKRPGEPPMVPLRMGGQ